MQAQNTLAKMGKGVEDETIKSCVILQLPAKYDTIIDLLKLRDNEIVDVQGWIDEILVCVDGKMDKKEANGNGKKRHTIANQANKKIPLTEIICQLCNQLGHEAKMCDLWTKLQAKCNYCKEDGHWVKDCPVAKRKDAAKKKKILANQARKQGSTDDEGSVEEDSSDEDPTHVRFDK